MSGAEIGAAVAVVLVALIGLVLDRRDKRKAAEREIKTIHDNLSGVAAARDRVRRIEAAQHLQSGCGSQMSAGRRLD